MNTTQRFFQVQQNLAAGGGTLLFLLVSVPGLLCPASALTVGLTLLLAASLFILTKSLYTLWGGWGVLAGSLWAAAVACGNYLFYVSVFQPQTLFLTALTAFSASLFRGWALLRQSDMRGLSVWLPSAGMGLFLALASELSIVLLPFIAGILLVLGWCSTSSRRERTALLLAVGFLLVCSVRFACAGGPIFNRTNLYHSFFDGVLLGSEDPEQTLSQFDMDPDLVQDVGKSAYLPEDAYFISPNGPDADAIYGHLSYPRILWYYLRHPSVLFHLTASVLSQAGHLDITRCVAESSSAGQSFRADFWDLLRGFFLSGPESLLLISIGSIVLGFGCFLRKQRGLAALLWMLPLSSWGLLWAALFGCGTADIATNRFFSLLFLDAQLCILLTVLAYAVHCAVRSLFYSTLSVRKSPEPIFPAEAYVPLPLPFPEQRAAFRSGLLAVWADTRKFAQASALACLLVMSLVLFVPRIGAYNNGDFGRMMDAMGLVYMPEDYFTPAVQYEKVIERYDYLEPYDWTRIRPGKMELTQSWLSAGMRLLYDLADVPFSTAVLAVFHLLTLTLCFYQLVLAVHRHWGKGPALLGVVLYLILFCGSYNIGWLNSLFGEGIAFVGLMLVLASSVYTLEHPASAGRRSGLLALAVSSVYLACAKAQYALLAPILLLWWAALAFFTSESRKKRLLSLVSTALVAVFLGSCAIGVYANNESISSQDTLYSGLLNGILLYADDPVQALNELGLDPGLAADKGKHPYLPKEEYYCPPRTEMAEELIYSKVSSTDYLLWYLRHPKAFWHLLDDTADASAQAMPDFNLYVGENNTESHRTVNKFNLWASLRTKLTPRWFVLYILLFGTLYLLCFAVMFRRGIPRQQKLYAGLLVVLIALGALQYPLPMVGNGHSDPVKQLYLFREVYDMVFLLVLVAVFRFAPQFRAFLRNISSRPKKGRHYAGT